MEGVEGGAGDEGGLGGYPEVADGGEGVGEDDALVERGVRICVWICIQ